MKLRIVLLFLVLISVSACHGFQTGNHSSPVGGKNSKEFDSYGYYKGANKHKLEFPGIELYINPLNKVSKTEMAFMFAVIPYHIGKDSGPRESNFTFQFKFKPKIPGFFFNPKLITLNIDNDTISIMDIRGPYKNFSGPCSGITSHNDIEQLPESNIELTDIDSWHCYSIIFDISTPSPEKEYSLDLSKALKNPKLKEIPLIYFKKSSWSYWGA